MGSKPNSWREKRSEQHFTHNRKAGSAHWWKEARNRKGRRHAKRFDAFRAENFMNRKPEMPLKEPRRQNQTKHIHIPTKFSLRESIPEEQLEKLKEVT